MPRFSDSKQKSIEMLVLQAKTCIDLENFSKALLNLHEALTLVQDCTDDKSFFTYFWSKLHNHFAEAYLKLDQPVEAYHHLIQACNTLRFSSPKKVKASKSQGLSQLRAAKKLLSKDSYGLKIATRSYIYVLIMILIIETRNTQIKYFRKIKNYELCFSIAADAFVNVVKYSNNRILILKAYTNVIESGTGSILIWT